MNYAIEQAVPVPPIQPSRGKADPNSFRGTLRRMEVGQSILVDKPRGCYGAISTLPPMKFTARRVSDTQTRIWRVA